MEIPKNGMTNKEVIEKLTEYFLKQDHRTVCRTLANYWLDQHRMVNIERLPKDEAERLLIRMKANARTLNMFVERGGTEAPLNITYFEGK